MVVPPRAPLAPEPLHGGCGRVIQPVRAVEPTGAGGAHASDSFWILIWVPFTRPVSSTLCLRFLSVRRNQLPGCAAWTMGVVLRTNAEQPCDLKAAEGLQVHLGDPPGACCGERRGGRPGPAQWGRGNAAGALSSRRATSCPRTSHRAVRKVNTRKTLVSCSRFSAILAFRGRTPGLRVRPMGTGTQNTSHRVPLAAETQQNRGRLSTLNTVIPLSTQKIQVIYFKTA